MEEREVPTITFKSRDGTTDELVIEWFSRSDIYLQLESGVSSHRLTVEDARALFIWLGVQLHRY